MTLRPRAILALSVACATFGVLGFGASLGCAGAVATSPSAAHPTACVPAPEAADLRRSATDALGRLAWGALSSGEPERLLYDQLDLRVLLSPRHATRLTARRLDLHRRLGAVREIPEALARAEYAGVCLQGARDEPGNGVLGLRSDGWVLDRVLVIGRQPSGRRVAAWIEGTFVYTDAGWAALDLERIESPRWEHSDLEIAPCDLSIRNDLPEAAR